MLKIAKSGFFRSWLYRFAYYGCGMDHFMVPENLCPFLRRALWGAVLCFFVGFMGGTFLVASALDPVFSFALWAFGVGSGAFLSKFTFGFGCVMWLILVLAGFFYLKEEKGMKLPKIPTPKKVVYQDGEHILTTWGVICEYCNAVHDKICPRIEFKG